MFTVKDGFKLGLGMLMAREVWAFITTIVLHVKHQVEKSQKDQPKQDKIVVLDQEA